MVPSAIIALDELPLTPNTANSTGGAAEPELRRRPHRTHAAGGVLCGVCRVPRCRPGRHRRQLLRVGRTYLCWRSITISRIRSTWMPDRPPQPVRGAGVRRWPASPAAAPLWTSRSSCRSGGAGSMSAAVLIHDITEEPGWPFDRSRHVGTPIHVSSPQSHQRARPRCSIGEIAADYLSSSGKEATWAHRLSLAGVWRSCPAPSFHTASIQ
jgi:hypothetical protein